MFDLAEQDITHEVDRVLFEFLDAVHIEDSASPLLQQVRLLIEAGGKRIRPLFCYWGHIAGGGAYCEPIIRAAASIELLHTFALLHDDIIDESRERRERPTVFAEHGLDLALLAGDLAFTLSDDLFWNCGFSPQLIRASSNHLSQMRIHAISGQYLESVSGLDLDAALVASRLKTAAYTVVGPLKVGAALAGAGLQALTALENFGWPLGEAFQLVDDLALGDNDGLRRPTPLLVHALPNATVERWLENDPQVDVGHLQQALEDSGSLEWLHERIEGLVAEAKGGLETPVSPILQEEAVMVLNHLAQSISREETA
ncbi:MAG: polyprenyl synthetase family protein [Actinomycetota bacterium]